MVIGRALRLRRVRWAALFAALVLALLCALPAQAERRVALVIGNGDYANIGRLPNPRNDAADIAAALGGMGFDVSLGQDVDEDSFAELLDNFASIARGADVAMFFYAGHGLQYQNENFLIPVNAKLKTRLSLKRETLALSDVTEAMRGARVSLVFVDACRSFPLDGTFFAEPVERITPLNGLAPVEPAPNSFIGFSASAGQTAADGFDGNSPFTSAMLEFLPRDGLDISAMFTQVSNQVRDATGGAQVPQMWANLSVPLTLVERHEADVAVTGPSEEERLYLLAREVGTVAAYRSFIARFPGGFFAELAKEELAKLLASSEEPPPVPEPSSEPPPAPEPEPPKADVDALIARCDELAGDPYDKDKIGAGVKLEDLDAAAALTACAAAMEAASDGVPARVVYQAGRAYEKAGDIASARKAYETAVAFSAEAQSALARFAFEGVGGTLDVMGGTNLYLKAAEAGSVSAMHGYARIIELGRGKSTKDEEKAADWYKRAVEGGYPPSMHALANMYRDGRGVVRSMQRAMQLYDKARARGYASSAYNLAWLLDVADGVPRNSRQSAEYFLDALASHEPRFVEALQRDGKQLSLVTRRTLQEELRTRGFYSGAIDGVFGPATNRAIAAAGGQG